LWVVCSCESEFAVAEKRPALGRGLSALIPDAPASPPQPAAPAGRETPNEVDLDLLTPNPFQPRVHFDDAKLDELARSIRSNGLIQPVTVRPARGVAGKYEIIAGERRWRAAQRAGLLRIPILVRDVPDEKLLEVALIENIQREDLNAIDEALAYRRLSDEFHLTQDDIATAVGKDRSSIANYLRLLKLPFDVQKEVANGTLSMGHARALLAIDQEDNLRRAAKNVLAAQLSVRETEALVREMNNPPASESKGPLDSPKSDANTRAAEEQLRLALGTRVRIMRKGKGGRVEIDFVNEDELNRIYEYILERR
jgi:ParB family transcriptional regulator, chromosome partitioning protein